MPEAPLHPIINVVRNIAAHFRYGAVTKAHDERAFFQDQRRYPLRLDDIARISVREALGGQHFVKKIYQLPLPSRMKSDLNSDYTAQLSRWVFHSNIVQ